MPDTAIHPIPKQGKFRRALAAVGCACSKGENAVQV
jgi:hypothetical protein